MIKVVNKNIILFSVGAAAYMALEACFRGFTFPLMGVCGGLCIVILDKINDFISWRVDLAIQALIGSSLITFMELVIGKIMKYTDLLPMMWDYSDLPLNYDGIICVPFSVIWLFLGVVAIFLADCINYYILEDGERPRYILFGKFVFFFKKRSGDNDWHNEA